MLKWVYWLSTGVLALIYLGGGAYYLSDIAGVQHLFGTLGYPAYLVPILAVLKPLAAVTILSRISIALSDIAYAGMFYHLLLAVSAHFNAGQTVEAAPALIGLMVLIASFLTQNAARRKPSPYPSLLGVNWDAAV